MKPEAILKVGTGVSIQLGSDRLVGTVVWVSDSGKTVKIQEDEVEAVNDGKPTLTYNYRANPEGRIFKAVYREKGGKVYWKVPAIHAYLLPGRHYFRDPHF